MPFRTTALVFVVSLVSVAAPPCASAQHDAPGSRLRPGAAWISAVLAEGVRNSPTLAHLVVRLDLTRTIVQVVEEAVPATTWEGRISFLAHAGGYRYLRVGLHRQSPATTAAVLAHELQHALEIDGADVASHEEFERLYRRIGVASPHAPSELDTPAAIAAGVATLQELTHRRVWLPAKSRRVLASASRAAAR